MNPVNAPVVVETQPLLPAHVSVDALLAGNGHNKPIKSRNLECEEELSSGSDIDVEEEKHLRPRSLMNDSIEGALPKLSADVEAIKKKFHKVPDGDHVEFLTDDLTAVDVAVVDRKQPLSKDSKMRTNGKCDEDVWADEVAMIAETIADAGDAMEHQEGDVGNYSSSITRQRRHRRRGDKMGNRGRNRVSSPYGGGGGSTAQAVAPAAGEYEYDGASGVTLKGHNTQASAAVDSKVFQQPRQRRRRPIEGKEVVVAAIDKAPSHGGDMVWLRVLGLLSLGNTCYRPPELIFKYFCGLYWKLDLIAILFVVSKLIVEFV